MVLPTLRPLLWCVAYALMFVWGGASSASAQGLLWSLPAEDGTWVRYEGDFHQTTERPESKTGPEELTRRMELLIKSVGQEDGDYQGKTSRCRWLEFKLTTGIASETGIVAGPYGTTIYKVLVPENRILGRVSDDRKIPVIFVPVVKGFRKVGSQPVQPIAEKVLVFYPLLGLFTYYPELTGSKEGDESLMLEKFGALTCRRMKGVDRLQSVTSRSVNEGEIWLTTGVPFGWAKYQAKVTREQKDRAASADAFQKHTELRVEMTAVETGTDARSELRDEELNTPAPGQPAPKK